MKTHAHDNAHAAQRRAVAHQAEHGEAAAQLAQAGPAAVDHHVNHSPRMVAQRQLLGAAFGPVAQREPQGLEEELPVQGKALALQAKQVGSGSIDTVQAQTEARAEANLTGMPNQLKSGVEALSGMDMSDVRVHRNSDKPAQLNALAYAQGNEIHLGPGQEQHLPHEAWHVVQQRQGRVQATMQMAGVGVNDDVGLEREADVMGGQAILQEAVQLRGAEVKKQDLTLGPTLSHRNVPLAHAAHGAWDSGVNHNPRQLAQRRMLGASFGPVAQRKPEGQADSLVSIKLSSSRSVATPGAVMQREFAVGVAVARPGPGLDRIVTEIKFGERPNTQFGAKQEDHVVAWTIKLNQIRYRLVGRDLYYAAAALITIVDDSAAALCNEKIENIAFNLGQAVQAAEDELDLQQAIQIHAQTFLERYNEDPSTTQKRIGKADKSEGVRVRAAKNEIFGRFASIPQQQVNDGLIEEFVATIVNTFQFTLQPQKSLETLVIALTSLISTALASVEGGGLQDFSNSITLKTTTAVTTNLKIPKKEGIEACREVSFRLRKMGFEFGV